MQESTMSDSDETVFDGSPSQSNNTEVVEEKSPSILTNWEHVEGNGVTGSVETDINTSEKDNFLDNNRNIRLGPDNNDHSQTVLSPEFPLLSNKLKRKDDVEKNDFCSNALPPKVQKPNSPKVQDYEIDKTETLMMKLKGLIDGMEEQKTTVDSFNIDYIKSKLAIVQEALSEGNKRNQAERKKLTSSTHQSSQSLSEENKKAIFDLARKQKRLLEVFKKYKNLVRRLKFLKEQMEQYNTTTPSEASLTNNNEILQGTHGSQSCANETAKDFTSSVSIAPNLSSQTTDNTQLPVVILVAKQPAMTSVTNSSTNHTAINSSLSQAKAPLVLGNMAGLKHVQTSSEIQKHAQTISGAGQPCRTVTSFESSLTQNGTAAGVKNLAPSTLQTAPVNRCKAVNIVGTTNLKKSIAKTDSLAKNVEPNRQENKKSSTALKGSAMARQRVPTNTSSASIAQTNKTLNMQNSCLTQSSTPQERRELSLAGTKQNTKSLNNTDSFHSSQTTNFNSRTKPITGTPEETRQVTLLNPIIPTTTEQCSRSLTVDNFHLTQSNNFSSQPTKPVSGMSLSLENLIKNGVLTSGKNVLTTRSEGKLYSASLSEKGTIISAGGEGFTSPRSWIKAIVGSKRKVKNDIAWKMVLYKEKPLLEYATSATASKSENQTERQTSIGTKPSYITNERDGKPNLMNSEAALQKLLWNCRVTPVTKEELMSTKEILGKDFWEGTEFELESLNKEILSGLEF